MPKELPDLTLHIICCSLAMATFTRIPDEERPSITVDPSAVISKIEDNTYGGFTE